MKESIDETAKDFTSLSRELGDEYYDWLENDALRRYLSVDWKEMTDTWAADHNSVSPFSREAGCFHRAYQLAQALSAE